MQKSKAFLGIVFSLCFAGIGNSATLGSITQQRAILEDLNLQVQIQEQSQRLTQLLNPVVTIPTNPNSTKELIEKLETPEDDIKNPDNQQSRPSSKNGIIAIHSNSKVMKATVRIKGKIHTLTNGQTFEGQKVTITREKVIIGNKTLEL